MASIVGTPLDDVLFGTPGSDSIDGDLGTDVISGGAGDDTYVIRNTSTQVYELPEQGNDAVISFVDFTLTENIESFNLRGGIVGGGNNNDNFIQANELDNKLYGFEGVDVIYGFEGNDEIYGGSGNDRLYGGDGNDLLVAGSGFDQLYGGAGNDTYVVSSYAFKIIEPPNGGKGDTIQIPFDYELKGKPLENLVLTGSARFGTGNELKNSLTGNGRDNVLSGLQGNDSLFGMGGNDELFGSFGKDKLDGGDGADVLYGQDGNDTLNGNRGNDRLIGETGRDTLIGYGGVGSERDSLTGGVGADRFVIGSKGDGGIFYLGSGYATITDFSARDGDRIQISGKIGRYTISTDRNYLGKSTRDAAIFRGNDLIAIVQDNAGITTRDFIASRT